MLIEIITRYDGQCFETGRHIPSGVKALFNPKTQTLWTWESQKYRLWRQMMPPEKQLNDLNDGGDK